MNKKLIIILIVIIITGLIIGGYFYLKSRKQETTSSNLEGQISPQVMQLAKLSSDKTWIYYYSSEQTPAFYRTEILSKKTEQISETLADIQEINFSPNLTKVGFKVIYNKDRFEKYSSPFLEPKTADNESRFWIYDFANRKLFYLNQNIIQYIFSPDSKKIFYVYLSPDGQESINQMAIGESKYDKIIDLKTQYLNVKALNNEQILLAITSDSDKGNGLYLLNIKSKKNELLTDSDFASQMNIYPDKKRILFDNLTESNNKISSIIFSTDISGKNKQDIIKSEGVQLDFDHLIWDKNGANCFVAAKDPDKDQYDKLYKIDLANKKITTLVEEANSDFEVVDINNDGSLLYYLLNSQLYAAKI